MESLNKWLTAFTERMAVRAGIVTCRRIISLSNHLHHIEIINMAALAEQVLPKLEKELEEIKNGKSQNYFNR